MRKEEEKLTPRQQPTGDLYCRGCNSWLAKSHDGIYLKIGNVRLYGDVKYVCECGKPHRFIERNPDKMPLTDAFSILNSLGIERKFIKKESD